MLFLSISSFIISVVHNNIIIDEYTMKSKDEKHSNSSLYKYIY